MKESEVPFIAYIIYYALAKLPFLQCLMPNVEHLETVIVEREGEKETL